MRAREAGLKRPAYLNAEENRKKEVRYHQLKSATLANTDEVSLRRMRTLEYLDSVGHFCILFSPDFMMQVLHPQIKES